MIVTNQWLVFFGMLMLGLGLGYWLRKLITLTRAQNLEAKLEKSLTQAKEKGEKIIEERKKEAEVLLEKAKQEEKEIRTQLLSLESRLTKKEERLETQGERVLREELELKKRLKKVQTLEKEVVALQEEAGARLEAISGLKKEAAKIELISVVEKDYKEELVEKFRSLEQNFSDELEKRARELMAMAMQRLASSQAAEFTTTTVFLPNEEMKGRIIGKEGRNIRALERLTGVEIIVDDTPGAILISGFSPVRRQVAKLALEKLMHDGRIQPAKIEETVEETRRTINQKIKEAGDAALYDLGITGIDPRLVQLIGSLVFRTSYGQNILLHSLEVAHLGAILAEELGANISIVKRACLLHDIGKAVDHEVGGTHIEIGRRILQKFGVPEEVVRAMQAHHEDYPYESLEARIVQVADALSSSRPGARKDTLENYLKRLTDLENVASSFSGVDKAYAIQAGREIRIFVKPDEIDDLNAIKLSKAIAKKIEKELIYPGEIKISVIRERRAVEYAK